MDRFSNLWTGAGGVDMGSTFLLLLHDMQAVHSQVFAQSNFFRCPPMSMP